MKKLFTLTISFCFFFSPSFSQDTPKSYIRQPALGISFFFNDYTTPQRIRSSSLSSVLANKQKAKIKEMDAGIAISYFQGLTNHVDFVGTLGGSFVQYDLEDRSIDNEKFLMEADASINLKLLTEKYWLTPFASIGAGISKYGGYYGAFVPVGLGLKLNIFDEAHLFYNTQYRIPVTPSTAEYHFMHGIGIAGIIGSKK